MKLLRVLACIIFVFAFSMFVIGQNGRELAKNFSAVSMNGEKIELNSLKGKVVVLTFWSTRCQNCHGVIPKLNRIAGSYKDKDVVFLALTSENQSKVESYLRKNQFDFKILPNTFDVLLKYADPNNTGYIEMPFPTHFLVNQNGEIEFRTSGFDKTGKLDSGINRLLSSGQARVE